MNIFYLHKDPEIAPTYLYDKHKVKMILETAQMLCTAHHHYANKYDIDKSYIPYKPAYVNHPSTVWARQSKQNYIWLWQYFLAINEVYTKRYGKIHTSYIKLMSSMVNLPFQIPDTEFTQPPQCMPDEYKNKCSVSAYWNYYRGAKQHIANKGETVYLPTLRSKLTSILTDML